MAFLATLSLGSILSASGTLLSGVTGLAAASYQASVANMNAQIAEENAKMAVDRGREAAQEQDAQTRAAIGEQVAVQSASGLSLNSRSQILTRRAARRLGRKDARNVMEAANSDAYNYKTQAANFKADAKGARLSGIGSALGSVLSAGSIIGRAQSTTTPYFANPTPRPQSLVY